MIFKKQKKPLNETVSSLYKKKESSPNKKSDIISIKYPIDTFRFKGKNV